MFDKFERTLAFRYLRARRKEGFISVITAFSVLGIILGVATLIIVMAVMNGFRDEMVSRVLGLSGHLKVYGSYGPLRNYDDLAVRLDNLTGVQSASPIVEGQALVTYGEAASGAAVRGILPEDFLARPLLRDNLQLESPEAFAGRDVVAIGSRMASRLGAGLGDSITLVAPQGNVTVFGTIVRMREYRIAAIFEVGIFDYDDNFVYMPLEAAQIFFQVRDGVTSLEVFLEDIDETQSVQPAIFAEIGTDGRLWDWQASNSSFFETLKVQRNVIFLILTLIVIVAAFNIISGMVMLVKDKGRDIAILRTMGATRASIMRVFFLTGASIGVVGTLIGLGLGVAFADNIESIRQWLQNTFDIRVFPPEIYFLTQLPSTIDWSEVVSVVALAIGLSFAATLYPSWRAARLEPVEALRYE